jgi:hypothetical protein
MTITTTLVRAAEHSAPLSRGTLTGALSFKISASGVVSACPVKTFMDVLLFSRVDRELFRTLCTKLTTAGHSSAYIFNSDSTARKARMNCLHADLIVPFDHGQFAVVK